jgi:aspartyl protease family protein
MKSAILPAVLMFGACAVGLMVVRDQLAPDAAPQATVALAEAAVEPAPAMQLGPRQAVLRKERDGHFWAEVQVNGASVRMMVDTGASLIVLTEKDARTIGFYPDELPQTIRASTAGGQKTAGAVTLDRVSIEGIVAEKVRAAVMDEALPHSLLGMSFLSQLSGVQVTEGAMVLRQ